MGKEKHNFREFFYLTTPNNPKSNKKAVCLPCIRKHTLSVATTNPECFVPNKALLCRNHLKKCENFASEYNESEKQEILSRKVPEDEKKNKSKEKSDTETITSPINNITTQTYITKQAKLSEF